MSDKLKKNEKYAGRGNKKEEKSRKKRMKTGKCIDNKNESGIILNVIDRFFALCRKSRDFRPRY